MRPKLFKSKFGLTRHTNNNKHRNDAPSKAVSLSNDDVVLQLAENIAEVLNVGLHDAETTLEAKTVIVTENQFAFLTKAVNKLNKNWAENFRTEFFSQIVASATSYITSKQGSSVVEWY